MCLCSLKQENSKKECVTETFSSRRETAEFPAQYMVSSWCTDPQRVGAHSGATHIARARMEYRKGKEGENLKFRFVSF